MSSIRKALFSGERQEVVRAGGDDFLCITSSSAVNGYVADALLGLVMAEGRRTRWHLLSMGDPGHAQSVHFSAHSVTVRDGGEHRTAVCNLYPGARGCELYPICSRGSM